MSAADPLISAQVVLKPARGKAMPATITAANVHEIEPPQDAVVLARKVFVDQGFETGELVANSFSITAAASTFEKQFKTRLRHDAGTGAVEIAGEHATELPIRALPQNAREVIASVIFTPPPDFGPRSY
jgi:hypothetical protein